MYTRMYSIAGNYSRTMTVRHDPDPEPGPGRTRTIITEMRRAAVATEDNLTAMQTCLHQTATPQGGSLQSGPT